MIGQSLAFAIALSAAGVPSTDQIKAEVAAEVMGESEVGEVVVSACLSNDRLPTADEINHYTRIRRVAEKLVERGANVINGIPLEVDALTRTMCQNAPMSKHWSRVKLYAIQGAVRVELGLYDA